MTPKSEIRILASHSALKTWKCGGIVLSSGIYENGDRTPCRNLRHEDEMKSKNLKNQGLIHCVHARLQGGGFFSSPPLFPFSSVSVLSVSFDSLAPARQTPLRA